MERSNIRVHFGAIRAMIIDSMEAGAVSIDVGVAWLTNEALFTTLVNKAAAGVKARVLISDSVTNFRMVGSGARKLDFGRLERKGGVVRVVETGKAAFFHHKYCIIDGKQVISGSYNWSSNAESNHENIFVTEDTDVVRAFMVKHEDFLEKRSTELAEFLYGFPEGEAVAPTRLDVQDDVSFALAAKFERKIQENMREGEGLGLKVNFERLRQKIERYTAVGAARELTNKEPMPGFIELAAIRQLDLSFERVVADQEFSVLFDRGTIRRAQEKLVEYGWAGGF